MNHRWTCPYCGANISTNGLATVSHRRKHVREGLLTETRKSYPVRRSRYGRKFTAYEFYTEWNETVEGAKVRKQLKTIVSAEAQSD